MSLSSRMLRDVLLGGLFILALYPHAAAQPPPAATAAFDAYIAKTEARLAEQHTTPWTAEEAKLLHQGGLAIAPVTPATGSPLPGALLHDWRGTAFVPGATAADFQRLLKDISSYPRYYSPQVLEARVIRQQGDHLQALIRVRQKHVLTVVMDIAYDISLGSVGAQHGFSVSRSTKISEIDSSGRALGADEEHGFLWRLNTYWSYEEREGGLYIQIESVTLTRSVPAGLGWVIGPFIEKIPRESLEFTLRSTSTALRK